ncbi:probable inactive receptor kinase At2g26730 [Capsicum annuum]|uniref:probable inactive receptor kinase At2g26730 n=1 Tax=Capsicum annuum TaxID=4072 RepID=UPI001FB14EAD|nr:probable inactive receptor kinase At2g26730 [Capsicum annuum]
MGGFPAVYSHGVYRLQILAATWIGSLAAEHQRQIPHIRGITIVGKLPASTGNLSTPLRTFVAVSCKIQGRIPNDFGNLSSLLDLILSGNNLVGSIAISIGNLSNLQRFDLSNNKLTGFIGDHICKFQHLGDSYLGQNQLSNNNAMQLS